MKAAVAVLLGACCVQAPAGARPSAGPADHAWTVLRPALTSEKSDQRRAATRVLGLLEGDDTARELALANLKDQDPEVRAAAADALGQMRARNVGPQLVELVKQEHEVAVVMAGARALIALGDPTGYAVYYAVLTGERKAGGGLLESQKKMLKDPKKMAEFGFEQGIGFIPFAGVGYGAIKAIGRDDASPVRAAAARILARDRDPKSRDALVAASGDKSWIVRAAALDALSRRGDPAVLEQIAPRLEDDEDVVKYTAAAATIHLMAAEQKKAR